MVWNMTIIRPENRPDAPAPATARPTIKALELGAVAQMREPISKVRQPTMKRGLAG